MTGPRGRHPHRGLATLSIMVRRSAVALSSVLLLAGCTATAATPAKPKPTPTPTPTSTFDPTGLRQVVLPF
jgi:hypothetical protein